MKKILLKHVGKNDNDTYQKDVAKITRITISVKSNSIKYIEMISNKELDVNRKALAQK